MGIFNPFLAVPQGTLAGYGIMRSEITPALVNDAMKLANTHRLRAYDAVQLATALDLHKDWSANRLGAFVFISADLALNAAAIPCLGCLDVTPLCARLEFPDCHYITVASPWGVSVASIQSALTPSGPKRASGQPLLR